MKRFRKMLSMLVSFLMIVTLLPVSAGGDMIQGENLALGATVLAESAPAAAPNEQPDKLFDDDHAGNKWCIADAQAGWVAFKLNLPANINRVKVYHTGNSSLDNNWDPFCGNTEDFSVQRLAPGLTVPAAEDPGYQAFFADDTHWVDIASVTGNKEKITDSSATMEGAEQIYRLNITKSGLEKNSDENYCIRVLGMEMFGQVDTETAGTVRFENNGGTGSMPSVSMTKGTVYTLPVCTLTAPENKKFNGWAVVSPEGLEITENTITVSSDVVIQPLWRDLNNYTITYKSGEGTGTMDSSTAFEDSTVKLPQTPSFTAPEGKVFDGWVREGSSVRITEIEMTSDVTVVATWRNENEKVVIQAVNGQELLFDETGYMLGGVHYPMGPAAVVEIVGNPSVTTFGIGAANLSTEKMTLSRKLELTNFSILFGPDNRKEQIYSYGNVDLTLDITVKGSCGLMSDTQPVQAVADRVNNITGSIKVMFTVAEGTDSNLKLGGSGFPTVYGKNAFVSLGEKTVQQNTNLPVVNNTETLFYVHGEPVASPIGDGTGYHTLPDGTREQCSASTHKGFAEGHYNICKCGYILNPDQPEQHVSDGIMHQATDVYHYEACKECGFGLNVTVCEASSYTDHGDGTHSATCKCGRLMEDKVSHKFNLELVSDGKGKHTGKCACGKVGEPVECTKSIYNDNGTTHTPVCECGFEFPEEAHNRGEDIEWMPADQHLVHCTLCEGGDLEQCTSTGGNYILDNPVTHYKECDVCGNSIFGSEEEHTYQWDSIVDEPTETTAGSSRFICPKCGMKIELPFSGKQDILTVILQSNDGDTYNYKSAGLHVLINGERKELRMPEEYTYEVSMEVSAKDEIVITYAHGYNSMYLRGAVVSADGKTLHYHTGNLEEYYEDELLYTNIPADRLADYTPIENALKKIPVDLSLYTPETVLKVQTVKKSLPPRYTTDQKLVDNKAKEILDAVHGLKLKGSRPQTGEPVSIELTTDQTLVITETGYSINGAEEVPYTGDYLLSGEGKSVEVRSGSHYITVKDLSLQSSDSNAFNIQPGVVMDLILDGTYNSFVSGPETEELAGLRAPEGSYLTIDGTGELYAMSSKYGAGIGGNRYEAAGNITFLGGIVDAHSEYDGAGIGGGKDAGAGILTFKGGNIYGECDDEDGAGIGCGEDGMGGEIRIHGGEVTGKADDSRTNGAGIGGADDGEPDLILITGGKIDADSDEDGAGIGGGDDSRGHCRIIITGGDIDAESDDGVGIGGGDYSKGGPITITNAMINIGYDSSGGCIGNDDENSTPAGENNYVHMENVSLFFNKEILGENDWMIHPEPTTPDGQKLMYLTRNVGGEDRVVTVTLPNGTNFQAEVFSGMISVFVRKQNITADDLKISGAKADYSEVDQLINSIPEDLNRYTQSSVKKLNDAVDAVVRDLLKDEQPRVDAMAEAIYDALIHLQKVADYTAVDDALQRVPGNLNKYTEDSVKDLQDALDSIVRDLTEDEQDRVDKMAEDILDALNRLERKPVDPNEPVDPETPETPEDPDEPQPGAPADTADHSMPGLWMLMALLNGLAAMILLRKTAAQK